jgi:hypothetical protein
MTGMVCCGSKTIGTECLAACGKLHQVCTSPTDCPAGDTCHMEPAGYGLCEHPKADAGSSGGDGGSSEAGDDGGGLDGTTGEAAAD